MIDEKTFELERKVFHLQTLYEIVKALTLCKTSAEIYREVLAILMGTLGVEYGLALKKENSRSWILVASRSLDEDVLVDFEKKVLNYKFDGQNSETKKITLNEYFQNKGKSSLVGNDSVWLELTARDTILGGIYLANKISNETYSEADLELTKAACSHVTTSLENLNLYEELQDAQERLQLENIALREEVVKEYEEGRIIGQGDEIRKIMQQARNVAKSPTNVLIYGETGTGKELVAKTIHYLSPRKDKPFVAVNCTAIPENLVESELFGIEAGVATGVKKHNGFFEQADGGTIFIDEIGDMPLSSQAKILRALQERCFRRVGGTKEISVDVRVICATNKNLEEEMKNGNFREDLYYRLSVLELQLPPLRNRVDDIPLLVNHFLKKLQTRIETQIKGFSTKAMKILGEYDWPGNVRELENEVERAITLAGEGAIIQPEDLSNKINRVNANLELPNALKAGSLREATDILESHLIVEALKRYHWNKSEVSRKLGISRLGLQKKIDRLGIQPEMD